MIFGDCESGLPTDLIPLNVMSITPARPAPPTGAYQLAPTRAKPGCRVRSSCESESDIMMSEQNLVKRRLEMTNRAADGRLDAFGHRGSRLPTR